MPKTSKMEAHTIPKSSPIWAKRGPGGPKYRKITEAQQKRGRSLTRSPHFERKSCQHGPKLGPKLELKWIKNPSKNRSKNWCLLGSVFGRILVDFRRENGAKLAPKSIENWHHLRKGCFWKNLVLPYEKQWFWRFGGSKLRVKID